MTGGSQKPGDDEKSKESFFDRVARGVHQASGDLTNKIVGFVAHEDIAEKFAQPINSDLARQYMQGKALVEGRQASGKSASDLSGLTGADMAAVLAYKKIHNDLPSSIPLVDRDALIRQVERNIEAKARNATTSASTVKIPEPHAVAPKTQAEIKTPREAVTPTAPKSKDVTEPAKTALVTAPRVVPKPNEPEARELKSVKSEESRPVAATVKAQAPDNQISTTHGSRFTPLLSGKQAPEEPVFKSQSKSKSEPEEKPKPEWLQERMQTFSFRLPAQGAQPLAVSGKLTGSPLPHSNRELTKEISSKPQRSEDNPNRRASSSVPAERSRWLAIADRIVVIGPRQTPQILQRPVSQLHENRIDRTPNLIPPSATHAVPRPRLLAIAISNAGFPIGRIFGEKLLVLPLMISQRGQDPTAEVIKRPGALGLPAGATPGQAKSQTKNQTEFQSTDHTAKTASTEQTVISDLSRSVLEPGKVSTNRGESTEPGARSTNLTPLESHDSVVPPVSGINHSDIDSDTESDPDSDIGSGSDSDSITNSSAPSARATSSASSTTSSSSKSYEPGRFGQTYIVRSFIPDKRYITGSELAFVAIMALASASRVRPEESSTEHGLGLVRREYVLVEEESWTVPGYIPPEKTPRVSASGKKDSVDVVPESRPNSDPNTADKSARKVLTRPQILVQENDDLCQMAGALFNDSRLGHLIADINRASISESSQDGARVVKLITRQRLSLPVYQDILTYSRDKLGESGDRQLITIVENTAIERELLNDELSAMLGFTSKNRDPLEPL